MFALTWLEPPLTRLADLYVAATPEERERMAAAVEAFNARLRTDPLDVGESRGGGYRVAFPALLCVVFHVSEKDRVVEVTWLRRYGR